MEPDKQPTLGCALLYNSVAYKLDVFSRFEMELHQVFLYSLNSKQVRFSRLLVRSTRTWTHFAVFNLSWTPFVYNVGVVNKQPPPALIS